MSPLMAAIYATSAIVCVVSLLVALFNWAFGDSDWAFWGFFAAGVSGLIMKLLA